MTKDDFEHPEGLQKGLLANLSASIAVAGAIIKELRSQNTPMELIDPFDGIRNQLQKIFTDLSKDLDEKLDAETAMRRYYTKVEETLLALEEFAGLVRDALANPYVDLSRIQEKTSLVEDLRRRMSILFQWVQSNGA